MKQILFLIFSLVVTTASAQKGGWQLLQDGKIIFSAAAENEEKNKLKLTAKTVMATKKYSLMYNAATAKGWKRYLAAVGANDSEIKQTEGTLLSLSGAEIKKAVQGGQTLNFYTWTIPVNPAKAATVRVRRVHLLTLSCK